MVKSKLQLGFENSHAFIIKLVLKLASGTEGNMYLMNILEWQAISKHFLIQIDTVIYPKWQNKLPITS